MKSSLAHQLDQSADLLDRRRFLARAKKPAAPLPGKLTVPTVQLDLFGAEPRRRKPRGPRP